MKKEEDKSCMINLPKFRTKTRVCNLDLMIEDKEKISYFRLFK